MPATLTAKLEGLEAAVKRLQALPDKVHNRVLRPAVSAASTPALKRMKTLANRESGLLKKSMGRKPFTVKSKRGIVGMMLGPRKSFREEVVMKTGWLAGRERLEMPAKIAHLSEGGTKAHKIRFTRGPHKGKEVQHPGSAPARWRDRAYQETKGQMVQIMETKIAEGVLKQAKA